MPTIGTQTNKTASKPTTTPVILLNTTIQKTPRANREQHTDDFLERVKMPRNEDLLDDIIRFFVSFHYNKLTRVPLTTRQRAQRAAARASTVNTLKQKVVSNVIKIGYLDLPMPNGKLFGDCTIAEAKKMAPKIGGLMNIIAKLAGKPTDIIRQKYSVAQLKKLAA